MKILLLFIVFHLSSTSLKAQMLDQGGYYQTGEFFQKYEKLKKKALKEKKPIVLLAGFKGCTGCEVLKERMDKNKKAYNAVALYMPISILSGDSRFFYTTLGIKEISSAPQSFVIDPIKDKAKKLDGTYPENIKKLAQNINWSQAK